jgi:hypothetical protein
VSTLFDGTGFARRSDFASGKLVELNLATDALTTIAEGASRGDFVIPDGSLLITQSDQVLGLSQAAASAHLPVLHTPRPRAVHATNADERGRRGSGHVAVARLAS